MDEIDELLSIRAAELYYEENKTQDEIGQALRLTRWKVGRLLAQAKQRGFIRIEILHPRARRLPIERRLRDERGLADAIVVSTAGVQSPEELQERTAPGRGRLPHGPPPGAPHARRQLGRTLFDISQHLRNGWATGVNVVQINGGVSLNRRPGTAAATAVGIAQKGGGSATLLPSPAILERLATKEAIESDRVVAGVIELARSADAYLFSAGAADHNSVHVESGYLSVADVDVLVQKGAVGDVVGPLHRLRRQHRRPRARRAHGRAHARRTPLRPARHRRRRRGPPSTPSPTPSCAAASARCSSPTRPPPSTSSTAESPPRGPRPHHPHESQVNHHVRHLPRHRPGARARRARRRARRRDAAPLPARHSPASTPSGSSSAPPALGTRSIKTTSKAWALDTIIALIDLTTLEGADTPGKVRSLVAKAMNPDAVGPDDARASRRSACTATWCRTRSTRSAPRTATPTTGSCRSPRSRRRSRAAARRSRSSSPTRRMPSRPAPTRSTWSSTAVRSSPAATAWCSTRSPRVKEACRRADGTYASLKVILETGELNTYDNVERASWLVDPRRRRLHQDLDGQGAAGGDAARHAPHARGRARLAPR